MSLGGGFMVLYKKGDKVTIITGEFKGKSGTVLIDQHPDDLNLSVNLKNSCVCIDLNFVKLKK